MHWYLGEVVPRECITNALPTNDRSMIMSSSGFWHMWEELQEMLVVEHAMEGGAAMVETLMEEEDEGQRRGFFLASGLVP